LSEEEDQQTFSDFALRESILKDVAAAGFERPTPIQAACIPPVLEGKDVIGLAQTGTGKTAAFALPIIERVAQSMEMAALVLAPTRELAQQISAMFEELGHSSGIRVATVVGGIPIEKDWKALVSWPNVLVATPGRLIDHMESGNVVFNDIKVFVVDEADRMHDMGFIPQIDRVIKDLPEDRQTLMLTATMPPDVERIARRNMRSAVRVQVGRRSAPAERAEQQVFHVNSTGKISLLLHLLDDGDGRVLVFARTKAGVDEVARSIRSRRYRVDRIHSNRTQIDRNEAMAAFRDGRTRVLVATDIAARGLDVADIEHVINYDFPHAAEDYVHRIGRTARVEASGRATSFVTRADGRYVAAVERLIGDKLPISANPLGDDGGRPERSRSGGGRSSARRSGAKRSGGGRSSRGSRGGRRGRSGKSPKTTQ